MAKILVVAYGNPLRSDDGLAWYAAEELSKTSSDLEIIRAHQLTPELAETISHAQAVIFVDALHQGIPGELSSHVIEDEPSNFHTFHHFTPSGIMSLAAETYRCRPPAVCISMAGVNFDHGEGLSPEIVHALPELVRVIADLARTKLGAATLTPAGGNPLESCDEI